MTIQQIIDKALNDHGKVISREKAKAMKTMMSRAAKERKAFYKSVENRVTVTLNGKTL